MTDQDSFQRFIFEDIGVRGELVRLDASWQSVLQRHPYPAAVSSQLGQLLAAAVLLSSTIKFKGSLILQAQSEGPLHTLVAHATHTKTIRGLAQWRDPVPTGALPEVFGSGRLALTIQNQGSDPYQGIVALEGKNLAHAIQNYFALSEQLATRLWLAADGERAAGLLIQELPTQHGARDDWDRIALLAETVTERELLHLPGEELLYRLFNEEQVRLFEPEPVAFRCSCSRERIDKVLINLGLAEAEKIVKEQGSIEVTCEFCNRRYTFDAVDVHALFTQSPVIVPQTRH
ncbi:MAG: Hsp33 protein [Proteobacteria bacterium]|nr:Hsp33 protein [Pseudomonadota bacterium]